MPYQFTGICCCSDTILCILVSIENEVSVWFWNYFLVCMYNGGLYTYISFSVGAIDLSGLQWSFCLFYIWYLSGFRAKFAPRSVNLEKSTTTAIFVKWNTKNIIRKQWFSARNEFEETLEIICASAFWGIFSKLN